MRTVISLAVVPLFIPLQSITAQQAPPIEAGARVRVTAPDLGLKKSVGTCLELSDGSMRFAPPPGVDPQTIPFASMTRLDVHRGRHGHPWLGAGIGFLAGAATGAVFGSALCKETDCTEEDKGDVVVASAAIFGAGGALLGALFGAAFQTDRWEEVPLDQLRVSFVPQRDGRFALGLSVEF